MSSCHRIIALIFPLLLAGSVDVGGPDSISDPVFEIRGWDIASADHIDKISKASEYGINTITLSHGLVREVDEVLADEGRANTIEEICREAKRYDMNVYLWTRQISNPPEHLVFESRGYMWLDFDHPDLWAWMANQYHQLFETVPCVDGAVLFFTESDFQLHRGPHEPKRWTDSRRIASNLSSDERMAKAINAVHEVHAQHGKQLIVRDFFRTPLEYDLFYEAMQRVPKDVIVYSRHKPNDFRYNYPSSPSYGRFDDRTHVVELEPSIVGGAEYLQKEIQKVRDMGMDGVIPRVRYGRDVFRDFNNYVYNRVIHNPNMDLDPLWEEFFLPYFEQEEAYRTVVDVLKASPDITYHNNYTLGFYLGKKGRIADIGQGDSRLASGESGIMWTEDPTLTRIEGMLQTGGIEVMDLAAAWHQVGERLAQNALTKLQAVREGFSDDASYVEIADHFEEELIHARSRQYWVRGYLALRYYRNNDHSEDARKLAHTALAELNEFIETEETITGTKEFASELAEAIEALDQEAGTE